MYRGDVLTERCPSGIPGFDEISNGGFIRNSINSVLGGPGAGKTIFLLQFLHNGVTEHDENGLFISFEPDVIELFKDARAFGWDFQKLDANGRCKFMRISPQTSIEELKGELTKVVSKYRIKRVCFDPISLFAAAENNEAIIRQLIYDMTSLLKRLNITTLLASETASGSTEEVGVASSDVKAQYVKFLVDGLVDLYSSGLGGVSDRAIRIEKMRRTNHQRGPVPMQITNDGIKILSKKGKGLFK